MSVIISYQRRFMLLFTLILLVFLVFANILVISHQRALLMEDERKRAHMELNLIGEFIRESFLRRDYATVSQFLDNWGNSRSYILGLNATLKNGYELSRYGIAEPAQSHLTVTQRVHFPNNYLDLTLISNISGLESILATLNRQLMLIFSVLILLFGSLLWYTVRKVALMPLEGEINRRVAELDAARQENQRMGAELEITRKLQQMMLPKHHELKAIKELDIAGFMEPASEVGGDYYDVVAHSGGIKIGIGDVTGHGLESGVIMLMVQMAVRTLLANNVTDPLIFLNVLNRAVFDNVRRMESDKNLTLTLLDYYNGDVRITGQHEEVLLVRKGGEVERVDTLNLGFMVGLEADIAQWVNCRNFHVNPGDGIVLYTDGLTEAFNTKREMYGLERLCKIISEGWDKVGAEQLKQAIINDVQMFMNGRQAHDDITLLVIKRAQAS
jgi:serine phosphatase RsbU (regulator of sigma subunit)